jgi:hypothetical protein
MIFVFSTRLAVRFPRRLKSQHPDPPLFTFQLSQRPSVLRHVVRPCLSPEGLPTTTLAPLARKRQPFRPRMTQVTFASGSPSCFRRRKPRRCRRGRAERSLIPSSFIADCCGQLTEPEPPRFPGCGLSYSVGWNLTLASQFQQTPARDAEEGRCFLCGHKRLHYSPPAVRRFLPAFAKASRIPVPAFTTPSHRLSRKSGCSVNGSVMSTIPKTLTS